MAYPVFQMSLQTLLSKSNLILPALQRDYVWKTKDICKLFDSLMQEYPINTMMIWQVSNIASQPIAFYDFLPANHIEGTHNTSFNAKKYAHSAGNIFDVVIDGQQRITSLLVGLTGSYKTPKAKNPSYLYLRLDAPCTNSEMKYDFQFLTVNKVASLQKNGEVWFKVADVMTPDFNAIGTLNQLGVLDNDYAQVTINKLWALISNNNVINYYNITSNNIDDVLEIFVRTNSGGYTLKKGDLLMSALTVNWANAGYLIGAREYVESIIDDVKKIGYKVDKDWVFNAFLMLTKQNMALNVSAFMSGNVAQDVYNNNVDIHDAIIAAFNLVKSFHLLEKGLTTKLAVIPIVYYLYTLKLTKTAILSTNSMKVVYDDIRHFLFRAILHNLFEARTPDTLKDIRSIIDAKASKSLYPFADIMSKFPQLNVTRSDIQSLLETKKADAFPVLNIIYALGYDHGINTHIPCQIDYEVDHIHPKTKFQPSVLATMSFSTPNDQMRANDGVTFDTVLNLELLDPSTNKSKNGEELDKWMAGVSSLDRSRLPKEHFFDGLPFGMSDFDSFVSGREKKLRQALSYL